MAAWRRRRARPRHRRRAGVCVRRRATCAAVISYVFRPSPGTTTLGGAGRGHRPRRPRAAPRRPDWHWRGAHAPADRRRSRRPDARRRSVRVSAVPGGRAHGQPSRERRSWPRQTGPWISFLLFCSPCGRCGGWLSGWRRPVRLGHLRAAADVEPLGDLHQVRLGGVGVDAAGGVGACVRAARRSGGLLVARAPSRPSAPSGRRPSRTSASATRTRCGGRAPPRRRSRPPRRGSSPRCAAPSSGERLSVLGSLLARGHDAPPRVDASSGGRVPAWRRSPKRRAAFVDSGIGYRGPRAGHGLGRRVGAGMASTTDSTAERGHVRAGGRPCPAGYAS